VHENKGLIEDLKNYASYFLYALWFSIFRKIYFVSIVETKYFIHASYIIRRKDYNIRVIHRELLPFVILATVIFFTILYS